MPKNKNPAAVFFWNDWENDSELRSCSLAAQGLWMRMLCIAARSPQPGFVQIEGLDCTAASLPAALVRHVGEAADTIARLIDELLTSGAASVDRKGRVYCRRMVRAAAVSQKRAESGRKGADVTNGRNKENEQVARQIAGKDDGKPPDKRAASSVFSLQSSDINPPSSPKPREGVPSEIARWGSAVKAVLGEFWPDDPRIPMLDAGRTEQWRADGYDLEKDVLPAIRATCADKKDGAPGGLKYFDNPIRRRHAERLAVEHPDAAELDARQKLWEKHGVWHDEWGPQPPKKAAA